MDEPTFTAAVTSQITGYNLYALSYGSASATSTMVIDHSDLSGQVHNPECTTNV